MAGLSPGLIFFGGLIVIVLGAELLLRGAERFARLLGIRPMVIGLTIVSVGTSMPELAVGITAAREGSGALAVGNIAGTNIFNILFILGMSAWIRALPVQSLSIRLDVPVMIATALGLIALASDGHFSRGDGLLLVGAGVAYTIALVRVSSRESREMRKEFAEAYANVPPPGAGLPNRPWALGAWNGTLLVVGIAVTVLGAELLVSGAVQIARAWGVSEAMVGLTIVAIGTSAPELATTLVATYKNDRDVAVGNLIGSSIYNVLFILGLTCAASPIPVEVESTVLMVDLPIAALVAIVCYPIFKSEQRVSRREGAALVAAYALYMASLLWLRA
jgi:cation:H+ antiporter